MPEWLTFLLADTSALQLVFWLGAIGMLIAVIVKLWPALSQFVAIMNAVTDLPTFIERTDESIAMLRKQVENDHDEEPLMREEITTAREQATAANELAVEINGKLDAAQAWQTEHTKESEKAYRRITALEQTIPHPPKEPS